MFVITSPSLFPPSVSSLLVSVAPEVVSSPPPAPPAPSDVLLAGPTVVDDEVSPGVADAPPPPAWSWSYICS